MKANTKYNTLNTVFYTFKEVGKKDRLSIFLYAFYVAFRLASNLLGVFIVPTLIDGLENNKPFGDIFTSVVVFVAGMLVCRLGSTLMNQLYWPRMSRVRTMFSQDLDELMLKMPFEQFEDPKWQDKFQNANNVINTTQEGITGTIMYSISLVDSIITFIIYLALTYSINYGLFVLVLVSVAVNYIYTNKTNKKNYDNNLKKNFWSRQLRWLSKALEEETHAKDIRLYHMYPWYVSKIGNAFSKNLVLEEKNLKNNQELSVFNGLTTFVCDACIYASLILQVVHGNLSVAGFSLQFSIIHQVNGQVNSIVTNAVQLQKYNLTMNDYRSVIESQLENIVPENNRTLKPDAVGNIAFVNVSFKYPNTDTYVLKNLSFKISNDEKVSLVGENGAGKSTIVKLLCRLYKPTEGKILLNGIDIRDYSEAEYRSLLSAVFQDTVKYGFNIAENVSMLPEKETNITKVEEALQKIGLLEKIKTFPNSYHSMLIRSLHADAVDLSGGEGQKLAIARALYKDAPIMILDEPTSALDAFIENQIYETINKVAENKIVIFISHRLASAKFCDKIIVLNDGHIEMTGNHHSLMNDCPLYNEMYNLQASGYQSMPNEG